MKKYYLKVHFISPTLLGSGQGSGAVIDNDLTFDDVGLPYFPARRLKGMLRESAIEVLEMYSLASLDLSNFPQVEQAFGTGYSEAQFFINDLYLEEYESNREWIKWGLNNNRDLFSQEDIIDHFTEIRQQTSIDEKGIAVDNSLRTSRVLSPGYTMKGEVVFPSPNDDLVNLLAIACANLRHVGTNRTKGFGEVQCSLWIEDERNLSKEVIESEAKTHGVY